MKHSPLCLEPQRNELRPILCATSMLASRSYHLKGARERRTKQSRHSPPCCPRTRAHWDTAQALKPGNWPSPTQPAAILLLPPSFLPSPSVPPAPHRLEGNVLGCLLSWRTLPRFSRNAAPSLAVLH